MSGDSAEKDVASCPRCGSVDAYHGVIAEPGEPERRACDECGHIAPDADALLANRDYEDVDQDPDIPRLLEDARHPTNSCPRCGDSRGRHQRWCAKCNANTTGVHAPLSTCPLDGQTLAWHLATELGPDGHPRTNGEFIGCPFATYVTSPAETIHTPCGLDWTDERGHHVCRFNMDHQGEHACACLECRITRPLPPGVTP